MASGGPVWPHVDVDGHLERAAQEWLCTNGAGAYASSTVSLMHTRRYHGLLVAALQPPRHRHVMLAQMDMVLHVPGDTPKALSVHQFPGFDPFSTPLLLSTYDQDPLPRWVYRISSGELTVQLAMVRGQNATVLSYEWQGTAGAMLELRPLLALRGFHELRQANGAMIQKVEVRQREVRIQPDRSLPELRFSHEGVFVGSPDWWHRFEYLAERDRGLPFQEDLWTPGRFEIELGAVPSYVLVSVGELPSESPAAVMGAARQHLVACDPAGAWGPLARRLAIAADAFRSSAAVEPSVVAGFPWLETTSRDVLMSVPGLYLACGKLEEAKAVVRQLIAGMNGGLVPDRFPEDGSVGSHGQTDAVLWLFELVGIWLKHFGLSDPFVEEMVEALAQAFDAITQGTDTGLFITEEGLFAADAPANALRDEHSWMDARVDGAPVVARAGCPIEMSALWAKGCETLSRLTNDADLSARAARASAAARAGIKARFWCRETGYPFDVIAVNPDEASDATVRCNAVLALAIDPDAFDAGQAAKIIERARHELVTPAGLRTLSPFEHGYAPHYRGGIAERDRAYHQGTVWPWLVGPFVRAALRVEGPEAAEWLERLVASAASNHIALGQVPQLADGSAPHDPGGTVAHATSVAELLRAAVWDIPEARGKSGEG